MKRCPTCNRTFTDPNLSFCIDDGTPLVAVADQQDETTAISPSARQTSGQSYEPPAWRPPDYQPPGGNAPAGKRKTWPWVVGILGVLLIGLIAMGIVAAILLPRMLRPSNNRNTVIANSNTPHPPNVNSSLNANSNLNTNTNNSNLNNANENTNASTPDVAPPTDEAKVLSTLTDLEQDWTVANLNADKKKLAEILADDYVGSTADGKTLGKAEYIRTIQQDTTTQKWDFSELKLSLKGPRATLSGVVKFETKEGDAIFRFTDKFVWREGRWQAIGSEISPIQLSQINQEHRCRCQSLVT